MTPPGGVAVLFDVEKARCGTTSLDVAHATLVTSAPWDVDSSTELTVCFVSDGCEEFARRAPAREFRTPQQAFDPLRPAI